MGGCAWWWVRTPNQQGKVQTLIGSVYAKGFDEEATKRQRMVKGEPTMMKWNTRNGNMHGVGFSPQSGALMIRLLGDHWPHQNDQTIDYNKVAIASIIAVTGEHVAMVNMIPMHATQACYKHQVIDWSSIGSTMLSDAEEIFGGSWSAGIASWCYKYHNTAECYVCMIGSKALWMVRSNGGASVSLNIGGFVPVK